MSRRLIHIIGSNKWRGKERYALDLCKDFSNRGWNVTAYTPDAKAVDSFFINEGIDLRHAPLRGLMDFYAIRTLAADFRLESPGTVVHCHRYRDAFVAIMARCIARRPDIRIVATRHCVRPGKSSPVFRWIYRHVDAHIFVSDIVRERFLSAWRNGNAPLKDNSIFVVNNSICIHPFPMIPEPEKGPRFGMFHGPLIPGKGLETLIDALPLLKGKRVRMIILGGGDPDYVDKLRRRAMTRGVMEMIDWKKQTEDPHTFIDRVHFGVQPSLLPEAFGLGNIEYMAHGRPVVCSNNGAQPEYITNGVEGLLVPPADGAALGEALLAIASDDAMRQKMGENAYRKFNEELSWDIAADKIEKIYLAE